MNADGRAESNEPGTLTCYICGQKHPQALQTQSDIVCQFCHFPASQLPEGRVVDAEDHDHFVAVIL